VAASTICRHPLQQVIRRESARYYKTQADFLALPKRMRLAGLTMTKLYHLDEAAQIYGMRREFLDCAVINGRLRVIRLSPNWIRIRMEAIDDWLAREEDRQNPDTPKPSARPPEQSRESLRLFSYSEAAKAYGIPRGTLVALVNDRVLPAIKHGTNWVRLTQRGIENWIKAQERSQ
jgi:excisionase family DNA binding protein